MKKKKILSVLVVLLFMLSFVLMSCDGGNYEWAKEKARPFLDAKYMPDTIQEVMPSAFTQDAMTQSALEQNTLSVQNASGMILNNIISPLSDSDGSTALSADSIKSGLFYEDEAASMFAMFDRAKELAQDMLFGNNDAKGGSGVLGAMENSLARIGNTGIWKNINGAKLRYDETTSGDKIFYRELTDYRDKITLYADGATSLYNYVTDPSGMVGDSYYYTYFSGESFMSLFVSDAGVIYVNTIEDSGKTVGTFFQHYIQPAWQVMNTYVFEGDESDMVINRYLSTQSEDKTGAMGQIRTLSSFMLFQNGVAISVSQQQPTAEEEDLVSIAVEANAFDNIAEFVYTKHGEGGAILNHVKLDDNTVLQPTFELPRYSFFLGEKFDTAAVSVVMHENTVPDALEDCFTDDWGKLNMVVNFADFTLHKNTFSSYFDTYRLLDSYGLQSLTLTINNADAIESGMREYVKSFGTGFNS